jgi:hypothetical protein
MLDIHGLHAAAEKGVSFIHLIESSIQVRDNSLRLIGDGDQFEIDFRVLHLYPFSPILFLHRRRSVDEWNTHLGFPMIASCLDV